MVSSAATSVTQYLEELPAERRAVVSKVRSLVRKHLPKGYEEGMLWGMIVWYIPLSRYPDTYNKQPLSYVALAAQKNNYALYLTGPYLSPEVDHRLGAAYEAAGKKLDMGKSCLRFKSLEQLEADGVADAIGALSVEEYLERYERVHPPKAGKGRGGAKPAPARRR